MSHWLSQSFEPCVVGFTGATSNLHALPMTPSRMEPELQQGFWLVMNFATWSRPDRDAIADAETIAALDSELSVGVRPFFKHDEIRAWCADATTTAASPVWLFFHDGQLVVEHVGLLSAKCLLRIAKMVREARG